jgi:hypothetical protein
MYAGIGVQLADEEGRRCTSHGGGRTGAEADPLKGLLCNVLAILERMYYNNVGTLCALTTRLLFSTEI